MKKGSLQKGFTLTELMLAMAFLAFVLVFIVTAILQYMATYNKGLVYKEINQAGRTIFEDVTRSMRSSSATTSFMDEGRLCVGGQAYIWNTPKAPGLNKYTGGGGVIEGIIRVPDSTRNMCSAGSSGQLPEVNRSGEVVIARPNATVQSFTGQEADSGKLYGLKLVLSTSGANAPSIDTLQCPPGRDGEFCAVASFETNISTRK